jgi:hypothetical protein
MSDQSERPVTKLSDDGLWWWDGSQWRPAASADSAWRWDGSRWLAREQPAAAKPLARKRPIWLVVALTLASFGLYSLY